MECSMKQKVTLSIDSEVYKQFRKYCDDRAILLSKKVEIWMFEEISLHSNSRNPARFEELTRAKQTTGMKKEQRYNGKDR